jgi:hypothetical protein
MARTSACVPALASAIRSLKCAPKLVRFSRERRVLDLLPLLEPRLLDREEVLLMLLTRRELRLPRRLDQRRVGDLHGLFLRHDLPGAVVDELERDDGIGRRQELVLLLPRVAELGGQGGHCRGDPDDRRNDPGDDATAHRRDQQPEGEHDAADRRHEGGGGGGHDCPDHDERFEAGRNATQEGRDAVDEPRQGSEHGRELVPEPCDRRLEVRERIIERVCPTRAARGQRTA